MVLNLPLLNDDGHDINSLLGIKAGKGHQLFRALQRRSSAVVVSIICRVFYMMTNPLNASFNNGTIRGIYCSADLGYCKGEGRRILVTYPLGESMSSMVIFEPVCKKLIKESESK